MHAALAGLLVQAPLYVIVGLVIAAIVSWSLQPLLYAAVFFVAGLLFNLALKHLVRWAFGADTDGRNGVMSRPSRCPGQLPDAAPGAQCEQCGPVVSYGPPLTGTAFLGMPSGHAQSMALVATAWTLYALRNIGNAWHLYGSCAFVWLWAAAVAFQRVWSGCHTWPQTCVGFVVGAALGFAADVLVRQA